MQRSDNRSFSARRSFLSRLGAGFAAVGATLGTGTATVLAQGSSSGDAMDVSESSHVVRSRSMTQEFLHGLEERRRNSDLIDME